MIAFKSTVLHHVIFRRAISKHANPVCKIAVYLNISLSFISELLSVPFLLLQIANDGRFISMG